MKSALATLLIILCAGTKGRVEAAPIYDAESLVPESAVDLSRPEAEPQIVILQLLRTPPATPPDNASSSESGSKEIIQVDGFKDAVRLIELDSPDDLPSALERLVRDVEEGSGGMNTTTALVPSTATEVTTEDWLNTAVLWAREGTELAILTAAFLAKYPGHKGKIMITATTTAVGTSAVILVTGVLLDPLGKEVPEKWSDLIEGLTKSVACVVFFRWSVAISQSFFGQVQALPATGNVVIATAIILPVVGNSLRESAEGSIGTLKLITSRQYGAVTLLLIPGAIVSFTWLGAYRSHIPGLSRLSCPSCLSALGRSNKYVALVALGLLGAGMLSDAMHEFEELAGESPVIWDARNHTLINGQYDFWSDDRFPMAVFSLIGYRDHPTVVSTISWFLYTAAAFAVDGLIIFCRWKAARARGGADQAPFMPLGSGAAESSM